MTSGDILTSECKDNFSREGRRQFSVSTFAGEDKRSVGKSRILHWGEPTWGAGQEGDFAPPIRRKRGAVRRPSHLISNN